MKKRILQYLLTAAAVLCCTLCAALSVSAKIPLEDTIPNCQLYDADNFFSAEDQDAINDMIRDTSREIDMYVAVCVLNESGEQYSDAGSEAYADDLYDEKFNTPYGKETDGVLLLLNMPTHYIYISTCGLGELYYYNGIADDRIDAMWNNMVDYMRNEDYTGAVRQFCSDLKTYKDKGVPKNAFTYNYGTGKYAYEHKGELCFADKLPWWFGYNWELWIGFGLIVGGMTALIAALIVKSKYKLVKTLDATNYISQKDTHYLVKDDVFLRTHTTKRRIDSDSGRGGGGFSGGGSSHTSSGGFSHGGGGGHW